MARKKTTSAGLPRGIDKRVNGMFRARVFWEGRQHSLGSFYTRGDAEAALAIARSEIARRVFIPPSEQRQSVRDAAVVARLEATTVAEWSADWLERLTSAGKSPGTVSSYRSALNVHVLEKLGSRRLIDVTPDDIDATLDAVRKRGGPWANVARTLRALFRAAISARVGGLEVSPVQVVIPKPAPAGEPVDPDEIASPAEVRKIAAAMPEHLRIAVPLAAWCALRLGEVLGLQRRDLEHLDDPERAVLHVRRQWSTKSTPPAYADPKRGSRRSVAIPAGLLDELANHVEHFAGPGREGPVLPSSARPGSPISQTAFDRVWRTARDTVRPGFRFHALRHTGLTEFARAGATLDELMKRGGHTNVEAALRYQHSTAARDRALTERLNTILGE